MINFDKTPNDTSKALSQTFPRYGGSENVDWEAVGLAVAAFCMRQDRLGLTSAEVAYLMLMHLSPDGSVIVDAPKNGISIYQTNSEILGALHKKGLIDGEYFNDAKAHTLPSLTELGLGVCDWLLQIFGYNGQTTSYKPEELIAELNAMPN